MPQEILFGLESDALKEVGAVRDSRDFYRQKSKLVEVKLLGKMDFLRVRVTHINEEKCFVSFVTRDGTSGFFRERNEKRRESLRKGSEIVIEVLKLETHKPSQVRSWRKVSKG